MIIKRSIRKAALFCLFNLVSYTAFAQNTFTWTGATSNDWQTSTNWTDTLFSGSTPGAVVNPVLDRADITTANNVPISLNGLATLGTLNVDVAGLSINGTGVLKANTIDSTGFAGTNFGVTLGDATTGFTSTANGTLVVTMEAGNSVTFGNINSVNNTLRSDVGTVNFNGSIVLNGATSGVVTTFRTNTAATAVQNFNGAISGTGSVLYAGAGTFNHNVANSYNGNTTLGSNNPNAASIHVINNNLAFSTGQITFTGGAATQTIQGDGSGPRVLNNRIQLSRDAIFAGSDRITLAGDIFQSNTRTLINNISGNQLVINGRMFAANDDTGRLLTIGGSGTTVINGAVHNRYDTTTSSPVLLTSVPGGSLGYNGTGTLILGDNFVGNYTGWTEVRQGTMQIGTGGAAPTLGGVVYSGGILASTGTMVFNHSNNIVGKTMNLQLNLTNTGGGDMTFNDTSFGGGLITSSGGGTVYINGGSHAGSTFTAARPTTNTLVVNNANAAGLLVGQTLSVSGVNSSNNPFTINGIFVMAKTDLGNGTTRINLSGNVGISDPDNVYDVVADAGTGTGSRSVLANGGGIGGTGVIGGNLTVASTPGSFVAPGASIGTLAVLGNGNILGELNIEYDEAALQKTDLITFGGSLNLGLSSILNLQQLGASLTGPSYIFATYGSLTGTFGTVNFGSLSGYTIDYAFGGNNIALIQAVPEPTSMALLGLVLGAGAFRRRR